MTRKNSFDAIRLFAAILVIFSHSFALTGQPEPAAKLVSLGAVGVWIFFILSGYLISKSWEQYPRFNVFFAKRALRIFPGLIVAILVTIAVTGLFFTTVPLKQFLLSQETWGYLNNIFLYNNTFTLPGVFTDNVYPGAVNGSIWTLCYEFTMYIAVAIIGVLKLYKRIKPLYFWVFLFIAVLVVLINGNPILNQSLFYLTFSQFLIFALVYFSGVMMHKYEKKIKLNTKLGVVSLVVFIGATLLFPKFAPLFASLFLAYAIFSIGRHSLFSSLSERIGDLSYGTYIYAFPIQQMIESVTHTPNPYKMFVLSLVLTLATAALSWHFIESKALVLKSKINQKRYPLTETDEAW
ncbi:MAG: acyltransferase [Candidatus Saccharimonadales bacterium]